MSFSLFFVISHFFWASKCDVFTFLQYARQYWLNVKMLPTILTLIIQCEVNIDALLKTSTLRGHYPDVNQHTIGLGIHSNKEGSLTSKWDDKESSTQRVTFQETHERVTHQSCEVIRTSGSLWKIGEWMRDSSYQGELMRASEKRVRCRSFPFHSCGT